MLVRAGTASTPTIYALNRLVFLELCLGHSANTRCVEIGFLRLDATQATELLITLFLPLCYQVRIRVVVFQQPVIELLGYCFLLVVEVVDISGALVTDLKNRPQNLMPFLPFMRRILRIFHLVAKLQQRVFYIIESFRWGFAVARRSDRRHREIVNSSMLISPIMTVISQVSKEIISMYSTFS